ncbi:hypothetical protein NAPIS_ORF01420 [Vairimorpha apis BRL 01]|uniref:FCP1 homology domain-containing protein n=1 Tax=Vairimorpha apis BRL 01 TaxID=1037528 RepID=T0L9A6_9MICR|nr:hypothetical protein NAPIS_ORF01420 [Vairimorpha apis BRL 01]
MQKYLLVLDINDTLLTKFKYNTYYLIDKLNTDLKGEIYILDNCKILKRQYSDIFLKYISEHNLDYIFWSTAFKRNIKKMIPYLELCGYTSYLGYLGQEECEEGILTDKIKTKMNKKNLKVVSKIFNINIEHCILIDNDENKRVGNQNFIKVEDTCPFKKDIGFINLCKKIDNYINCKDDCTIKRIF